MKFGKEFIAQMVPEWQDAYMDYTYLKTILKEIKLFHLRNKGNATPRGLSRKSTFYRAFSGLTQRHSSMKHPKTRDVEDPVILVNVVQPEDSEQQYETMFFMSTEEGGENELYFFRRLDDEFNKVDKFYKGKVQEVVKEAEFLNKQMDALIAFRLKVENPARFDRLSAGMTAFASDVPVSASAPNGPRTSAKVHITVPEENQSKEASPAEVGALTHADIYDKTLENSTETKLTSVEILKRVTINAVETPLSTIKGLLKVESERETSFGSENLRRTEEQLKRAFVEFYQKLRLLKNYSFLNLSAFSKIMKKYDKATSRSASRSYLSMVDNSYIGSSDEVTKLIERVENTFIKHFSSSNRSKGMGTLRPKHQRERHRTTFSLGFFTGCAIALLVALVLLIHIRNILKKDGFAQYMENMFPLYSLFGFIFLHMIMYGGNIYFWRRYRINYPFIFGFKQGTELGYRQVFLVSTGLATLALASVLANLDMEMDENTKDFKALTELLPLGLVVLVLVVTFCPLNIIYRSSRVFLLQCVFRCICAPLYKVTLPDFFLADQITSQIQALRSLEFYICYYGWGDFKQRRNTCKSSDVFNTFYFIVATIPYWCRLLQCLRRLYEERDPMQGYNGLKYLSTVVAVLMRTAYSRKGGDAWWALALGTSIIATIFSTYWDLIVDWGLLQRRSKNRWLRDKLILSTKSVYFGVMVLNILLRLAWLQTVLNFKVSFLHRETLIAIVASLEIIRRGIWNFFRLENEHLNNVGKYRAFKSVPLPFNYDENNNDD